MKIDIVTNKIIYHNMLTANVFYHITNNRKAAHYF